MHEETFNILSHQGNANQNDTEIPSHSSQNGSHQEHKQQLMLARMQGVGEKNLYIRLAGM
jgi:hypothetical protein